jgi:hypothetical protein
MKPSDRILGTDRPGLGIDVGRDRLIMAEFHTYSKPVFAVSLE